MEKSLNFEENLTRNIWKNLELAQVEPRQLSPLVLAYIGDSIYDLVIRTYLISLGNMPVNKINRHACRLVKAETQSKLIGILEEQLTENELSVYKRGRNAKGINAPKHSTVGEYRMATGLECLFGFLYLTGREERIGELFEAAWSVGSINE